MMKPHALYLAGVQSQQDQHCLALTSKVKDLAPDISAEVSRFRSLFRNVQPADIHLKESCSTTPSQLWI